MYLKDFFKKLTMKQEGPRALDHSPESWRMIFWPVAKEISFEDISSSVLALLGIWFSQAE